jgi:hypothetical protein
VRFVPAATVEPRPADEPRYVRSYVFTRFAIGVLGLSLPPLLVLLEPALFEGLPAPRGSLSAYYYSGVRELFVGGLWAIGVFLLVYKFLDFSWESLLSSLAGVAAICVAIFPTERPGDGVPLTPFQAKLGEGVVSGIHYTSAAIFIGLLIPIVLFFSRDEGRRRRRNWRSYHAAAAALILVGAGLAAYAGVTGDPDKGVLYGEWIAVWSFGAAWVAKGAERQVLFGRKPAAVEAAPETVALPEA